MQILYFQPFEAAPQGENYYLLITCSLTVRAGLCYGRDPRSEIDPLAVDLLGLLKTCQIDSGSLSNRPLYSTPDEMSKRSPGNSRGDTGQSAAAGIEGLAEQREEGPKGEHNTPERSHGVAFKRYGAPSRHAPGDTSSSNQAAPRPPSPVAAVIKLFPTPPTANTLLSTSWLHSLPASFHSSHLTVQHCGVPIPTALNTHPSAVWPC
ncbi:uncharacterized protein LOC122459379 [Dermochelys coriacea]|uniref:uncharacterized protein LOC122459379 n=1 Tax=Dermochelys coriacea TaxID=27794 RepID=UPI001CA8DBDB|nr:uncharacterized protein LOC122459379 [Dermochelys coriacea]